MKNTLPNKPLPKRLLVVLIEKSTSAALTHLVRICKSLELEHVHSDVIVFATDDVISSHQVASFGTIRILPIQTRGIRSRLLPFIALTEMKRQVSDMLISGRHTCCLLYGVSYMVTKTIHNLTEKYGVSLFIDVTEHYPLRVSRLTPRQIDLHLFSVFRPPIDGAICISSYLQKKWDAIGVSTLKLPSLFAEEYESSTTTITNSELFTLTYIGGLASRDLPDLMFGAFEEVVRSGVNARFNVVGRLDAKNQQNILKYLDKTPEMKPLITFHGRVSNELMKELMEQTSAFLLLRRENDESIACFPTRLLELMATGRPVVVSSTSNITEYLEDGRDAFMVEPNASKRQVGDVLINLARNTELAQVVGQQGRLTARDVFGLQTHAERIASFLFS